jgi:hypothetical protein
MANNETDKNIISSSDDKQVSSPIFETIKRPASEKAETSETIGLLMDVELELTAQLGSCELPLKNILPLVFPKGVTSLFNILSNVDFPHPVEPIIVINSPLLTENDTLSTALFSLSK